MEKWIQSNYWKKIKSNEGPISIIRNLYYKIMYTLAKIDGFHNISNCNGFSLYDKEFRSILKLIEDPEPYFKNLITQFTYKIKDVNYIHEKIKYGKTSRNFYII